MRHILIVGAPGAGKTTLIRRVLDELKAPLSGFMTRKEDALADEQGSPVYIYGAGNLCEKHLVGYSRERKLAADPAAFDQFAPQLLAPIVKGAVILMDELGVMESGAKEFRAAVLSRLDGDIPVIAAVKDKETPFLQAVRTHPNCRCFYITRENRENLFHAVLKFAKEQLENR